MERVCQRHQKDPTGLGPGQLHTSGMEKRRLVYRSRETAIGKARQPVGGARDGDRSGARGSFGPRVSKARSVADALDGGRGELEKPRYVPERAVQLAELHDLRVPFGVDAPSHSLVLPRPEDAQTDSDHWQPRKRAKADHDQRPNPSGIWFDAPAHCQAVRACWGGGAETLSGRSHSQAGMPVMVCSRSATFGVGV